MKKSAWDYHPELIDELKTLHAEGLSFAQMARRLGHGLTRNAVLGKATRLNLPQRAPHRHDIGYGTKKVSAEPALAVVTSHGDEPIPLLEPDVFAPNGQCKWPHGDTGQPGWRMCGHLASKPGSPWCAYHYAKAYDRPKTIASQNSYDAKRAAASVNRMMARAGLG